METFGEGDDGETVNREIESWQQLCVQEDSSQFLEQTPGLMEANGLQGIPLNSKGQMASIGDSNVQPASGRFELIQLELQDSCLSPTLTLIPQGKTVLPSESTLLHQTDLEFVPLRGSPDLSTASERCPQMSHLDVEGESTFTHTSHDQTSLSQHPLGVMSAILEDTTNCCSLSQHSLSPSRNHQAMQINDEHGGCLEKNDEWQEGDEQIDTDVDRRGTACGFNCSDPVSSFRKAVETDLGVAGSGAVQSSSVAIFSQSDDVLSSTGTSEIQMKNPALIQKKDPAGTDTKESQFRPSESREQLQGSSSSLSQRTTGRDGGSLSSRFSAISNITVRSTSRQMDNTSDLPVRQLQLQGNLILAAPGGRSSAENKSTPAEQNITPASGDDVCMAGLHRVLWSSGSHQAADGSFLTSQPVFQSTPAVFLAPRGAPALSKLSPVFPHQDTVASSKHQHQKGNPKSDSIPPLTLSTTSDKSIAGIIFTSSLGPDDTRTESHLQHETTRNQETIPTGLNVPVGAYGDTPIDQPTLATLLPTSDHQLKDQEPRFTAGSVHSLPSVSYMQKVDAWNANQNSIGSFSDNLSLQGCDSVPPKNKEKDQQCPKETSSVSRASRSSPSHTGSDVLAHAAVVEAGRAVGSTSQSPFTQSHSYSSLGTVIPSFQQDKLQQNQIQLVCMDTPSFKSTAVESSLSVRRTNEQRSANDSGQYSTMNLNTNMSSKVSSCHLEQNFQASLDAVSSVVNLEVNNTTPYRTSRSGCPPVFNIEDRNPHYLHNLGIDQSPSTILNPFTRHGPIKESDLCTIKGSVGTPTKSIQPSDGDSPQEEVLSGSSTHSFIHKSIPQPARPARSASIRIAHFETHTPPEPHSPSYSADQGGGPSLRVGGYGLPAQVSLESASVPDTWDGVKNLDSSLVGSGTLQEIRHLLGHVDSTVSGHFSMTSPQSQCYLDCDASLLSVDGNISSLRARCSSDSVLKEGSLSSSGVLELSTKSDDLSNGPLSSSQDRKENLKSQDFHVAPRRAEPEGCSAADPDKVGPVSMLITQGDAISASDGQQQCQNHTEKDGISSSERSATHSQTEAEMGVLSDASSEHSLASRVAKLLQSDSSISVVTSRSSTADLGESRARGCITRKVSGGKYEALELNAEDRRRIEEIKRELLLYTKHTKSISDSESSTQSSDGIVPQPAVGFAAVHSAEDHLTEQLKRVIQIPLDSSVPLHTPSEDEVSQIASKEETNPQYRPSPQSGLLTHNSHATVQNDSLTESNSYTTLWSSEEWKFQTQITTRASSIEEGKATVKKDKKVRDEDETLESERNDPLPIPEVTRSVIKEKQDISAGLRLDFVFSHEPDSSYSQLTPAVNFQQNTNQRPRTPSCDSCSNSIRTGSHTHHSDKTSTSEGVPLSVSCTSEDQKVSVSTESRLNKDRNADHGQNTKMIRGYSQVTSRNPQAFTHSQRLDGPSTPVLFNTAAIPTLLPYKPHGSSELFYMPQSVPELSPNCSDTTVESSHPGSDDAVPPQFTPETLGSRELLDYSVTPKHKEGIYSKRAKMKREALLSDEGSHGQSDSIRPPYQLTGFRKSVIPENEQVVEQIEERESFIPQHIETDDSKTQLHCVQKHNFGIETQPLLTEAIIEKEPRELGAAIGGSLDQLWHRFNEQCNLHEIQSSKDVEMSLLERLERLSRLLHSSSLSPASQEVYSGEEKGTSKRKERESRKTRRKDTPSVLKTAWDEESLNTNQVLVQEQQQVKDYRCPAERDESASVSVEMNSSQSTIDTQRLIRAFGLSRVSSGRGSVTGSQTLKPSDGLHKLYNAIKKQKRSHEQGSSENLSVATDVSNTDDATASDTLSSSNTYTRPSHRGTGCASRFKRAKVKLVSRSIQAGDFEIVVNGTRQGTRDVGTTFPSPASSRVTSVSLASCSQVNASTSTSALRNSCAASIHPQPVQKRHAVSKNTSYPNGLSWFVSADELKWDARKENKPETGTRQSESQAWVEPYTRTQPWRDPLRERHIQVEREQPHEQRAHSGNDCCNKTSALVRLSLQEALELHRPKFVSRSRERMKRLCFLVEERKMQAVYNKERDQFFQSYMPVQHPKAASILPPLPSKRVIPMSEMIQRSKRIYAQLPEVQRRKEEERRKAEYRTYRLNAQLFNKKVTNRVLGRRVPWQ